MEPLDLTFASRVRAEVVANVKPAPLKRDDLSSNRHPALAYCPRMIFSENRYPLFGIML